MVEGKRDRLTVETRDKLKTAAKVTGMLTVCAVAGWAYGRVVGNVLNTMVNEEQ